MMTWPSLFLACATSALLFGCSSDGDGDGAAAGQGGAGQSASSGGAAGSAGAGGLGGFGDAGGQAQAGLGGASGAAGSSGAGGVGAAGAAGGSGAAGGAGGSGPIDDASATALIDLANYLEQAHDARAAIDTQPFATVALTRADSERATELLWEDFAAFVRETRAGEVGATESVAATVQLGDDTLRYYQAVRGEEPSDGYSLFISMHGGGNAPAATNDSQWENQIALVSGYEPQDAIWIAPRAPIDDWNMWFVPSIDPLFERLITNLIVFEHVNPNKVYINGYSAGGDGVYQLGPRMADHWAGAAMSAGHPNDASPVNLRNVAFAIHVGGDDTAYDRNLKAAEWGGMLEDLAASDGAGGYVNQWQVHAGLPHWMELEDAVAIPFVQMHTRNPVPAKVVWRQADVIQARFYWLAVEPAEVQKGTTVTASYAANEITLSDINELPTITLRLSDAMMDLDQPVTVAQASGELFSGAVTRTIAVIARTLEERGDPALIFPAEVAIAL